MPRGLTDTFGVTLWPARQSCRLSTGAPPEPCTTTRSSPPIAESVWKNMKRCASASCICTAPALPGAKRQTPQAKVEQGACVSGRGREGSGLHVRMEPSLAQSGEARARAASSVCDGLGRAESSAERRRADRRHGACRMRGEGAWVEPAGRRAHRAREGRAGLGLVRGMPRRHSRREPPGLHQCAARHRSVGRRRLQSSAVRRDGQLLPGATANGSPARQGVRAFRKVRPCVHSESLAPQCSPNVDGRAAHELQYYSPDAGAWHQQRRRGSAVQHAGSRKQERLGGWRHTRTGRVGSGGRSAAHQKL